jgi:hypothetical protein
VKYFKYKWIGNLRADGLHKLYKKGPVLFTQRIMGGIFSKRVRREATTISGRSLIVGSGTAHLCVRRRVKFLVRAIIFITSITTNVKFTTTYIVIFL